MTKYGEVIYNIANIQSFVRIPLSNIRIAENGILHSPIQWSNKPATAKISQRFTSPAYMIFSVVMSVDWFIVIILKLPSSLSCDLSSGSSHRGGAARPQASRQTPQSPADVAHLELPDLGAEDVLELQLQQLSLAQFTVAAIEHATPLLKTGGNCLNLFFS